MRQRSGAQVLLSRILAGGPPPAAMPTLVPGRPEGLIPPISAAQVENLRVMIRAPERLHLHID